MDPSILLLSMIVAALGGLVGGACALVPGFHVNTLALVLLSLYPTLASSLVGLAALMRVEQEPFLLFAILLVSAATAHSFVDIIPSTFLGVPDEDTVLSMLPAHRLVALGKGSQAVQCAATGSLSGALLAIILVVPMQVLLRPPSRTADWLDLIVPYFLLATVFLLILTEKSRHGTKAYLDARYGTVMEEGPISISHPVPVNGQEGTLTGKVRARSLRTFHLLTLHGEWKVLRRIPPREGWMTVRGTWVVKPSFLRGRLIALSIMSISGLLGLVVMNSRPPLSEISVGLGQSLLFPLLSGLFAIPTLLSSMDSAPMPEQEAGDEKKQSLWPALMGTFAGFLAGWLPGITSTIGTVIGTTLSPPPKDHEQGTKDYIFMVSAVGTSAVVFSLLALVIQGKGRTGAMLALKEALGQDGLVSLSSFPGMPIAILLLAVLVGAAIGYLATIRAGTLLARMAAGKDLRRLNLAVLLFLLALISVFNGLPGLVVAATAALVGSLPSRAGVRRVHLTGCLLLPLLLFYFDMEGAVIDLIW